MKRLTLPLLLCSTVIVASCTQTASKPATDPKHGVEQWTAVAPLQGTVDKSANGAAIAHFFEDGTYRIDLQLNISPAPTGKRYLAWLTSQGSIPILLGTLTNPGNDARHVLPSERKQDLRSLLAVSVTAESEERPTSPSYNTVADGQLKVVR